MALHDSYMAYPMLRTVTPAELETRLLVIKHLNQQLKTVLPLIDLRCCRLRFATAVTKDMRVLFECVCV